MAHFVSTFGTIEERVFFKLMLPVNLFDTKEEYIMPLTPLDIHNKEFSRGMRGYDQDEVNEFLDQVMKDFELVIREKKELKREVELLEDKLAHFSNIEETLNKSILVAQQTADEVKGNAMKESKLIVREAEKNADRIINEALEKARRIEIEVEELKKQGKVFRTRLKMLIEAQLELVEANDWDQLLNMELNELEEDDSE
jgi:cell division initiation protein